jgi:hypothetical protein
MRDDCSQRRSPYTDTRGLSALSDEPNIEGRTPHLITSMWVTFCHSRPVALRAVFLVDFRQVRTVNGRTTDLRPPYRAATGAVKGCALSVRSHQSAPNVTYGRLKAIRWTIQNLINTFSGLGATVMCDTARCGLQSEVCHAPRNRRSGSP